MFLDSRGEVNGLCSFPLIQLVQPYVPDAWLCVQAVEQIDENGKLASSLYIQNARNVLFVYKLYPQHRILSSHKKVRLVKFLFQLADYWKRAYPTVKGAEMQEIG